MKTPYFLWFPWLEKIVKFFPDWCESWSVHGTDTQTWLTSVLEHKQLNVKIEASTWQLLSFRNFELFQLEVDNTLWKQWNSLGACVACTGYRNDCKYKKYHLHRKALPLPHILFIADTGNPAEVTSTTSKIATFYLTGGTSSRKQFLCITFLFLFSFISMPEYSVFCTLGNRI